MWTATSVTVSNGSKQVTVNSGDSTSLIRNNSWLQISNQPIVEIQSVSGPTITLKDNWSFPTQTNQPAFSATTPVDLHIISDELKALYDNIVGSSTSMTSFMQALLSANSPDELAEFINAAKTTTQITGSNGIQVTGNWQNGYTLSVDDTIVRIGTGPTETLSNDDLDAGYISKAEYEQLESAKTFDARFGRKYYEQYEVPYGKTRKTFDEMFTINRNSSKWCFGKDRKIVEIPPNEPAYEYDPVTGEPKGILIEEQRTNLLQYSENFYTETTNWVINASTVFIQRSNETAFGKAVYYMYHLVTSGNIGIYQSVSVTAGKTYTFSVIAAKGTSSIIRLRNGSGINVNADFNFDTGTFVNVHSSITPYSEYLGGGYWRLSMTRTYDTTSSISFCIYNTGLGITKLVCAQIEEGSFPTSYISTAAEFVSRASTATYIDSNGVLQTAAVNEPRESHVYVDGEWVSTGLLTEPSRTNLVTNSTGVYGGAANGSRTTSTTVTSPFGGTVTGYTANSTNTFHAVSQFNFSCIDGQRYTVSALIKKGNGVGNYVAIGSLLFSDGYIVFDMATGEYSRTIAGSTDSIEPQFVSSEHLGNGWYRLSMSRLGRGTSDIVRIFTFESSNNSNYVGNGNIDCYIADAQVEQGSYPTSYIPTSGSQVTRAADVTTSSQKTRLADVCMISDLGPWFNPQEGTFVVEWEDADDVIRNASILAIGNGGLSSSDSFIVIQRRTDDGGKYSLLARRNDNGAAILTTTVASSIGRHKAAMSIVGSTVKLSVDGSAVVTATNIRREETTLFVGGATTSGGTLDGSIKHIDYKPRAVSDTELQKLSSLG